MEEMEKRIKANEERLQATEDIEAIKQLQYRYKNAFMQAKFDEVIACLPSFNREAAIQQYIEQCREINNSDPAECKALEEDIRLLVKQKVRLFPDVNVQIVNSKIDNIGGQDHAIVVTARIN